MKKTLRLTTFMGMVLLFFSITVSDSYAQINKIKKKKKKNANTTVVEEKKPLPRLSQEDQQRVEKLLFDGIQAKIKDDNPSAIDAYNECLKIDPKNDAALFELARLYQSKEDAENAINFAEKASIAAPDSKWHQILYSEALLARGRYGDAADVYRALSVKYPNNIDYYLELAYLQIQSGEYDKAIETYSSVEGQIGVVDDFIIQKIKLYQKIGKKEEAIKECEKLVDLHPNDIKYRELLAELYRQSGQTDKAAKLFTDILESDPDNVQARAIVAQQMMRDGDEENALTEMNKVLTDKDINMTEKIELIATYAQNQDLKSDTKSQNTVIELGKNISKQYPSEVSAQTFNGDLLLACGKKQEALKAYKKSLSINHDQLDIWREVLWIEYDVKSYKELTTDSKEMISIFPNQPIPYYFNGLSNIQLENYEKAVKSLEKGAMVSVGDPELQTEIYSLMGEAYNSLQDYSNSDKNYTKALEISPDNPSILNNYSYYLSLRGNNLAKAAEMSKKCNELSPNNPSYLDTYGWILYKQNKYSEAKTWIAKALTHSNGKSGTVLEHYGDVLYKLNDKDGAVQQWKKARESGENIDILDRKIKERRLID